MPMWVWFGVAIGVISPWVINPKSLLVALQERGIGIMLGVWLGMMLPYLFIGIAMMWVISRFVDAN